MLLRWRAVRLLVTLLGVLPFTGCRSPTNPEMTVVVYGTVWYADEHTPVSGGPVPGARVSFGQNYSGEVLRVYTNESGEYQVFHRTNKYECARLLVYAVLGNENGFYETRERVPTLRCTGIPQRLDLVLHPIGY